MNIGVIFCSCSGQIDEKISFNDLRDLISKEVEWIERFDLACSEDSQRVLSERLSEKNPEGLIILACSIHNKGSLFEEIAKRAGINPYMVNIVNLREQVAWVTKDKEAAIHKAYALFKGALDRLKKQTPLAYSEFPVCQDVLVVGGGISGINAALLLSKTGRKVFLIEREDFLGGKISRFEKLFPDLSCAPCYVHPMIEEILNGSVELRLNAEIREIKGYFGNIYAEFLTKPTYVNPKKCIGCSACEDICTEGAIRVDPIKLPPVARINLENCLNFKGDTCSLCKVECPVEGAIDFSESEKVEKIKVGSVIWATGFNLIDCSIFSNLGYGKADYIYNAIEFEEILNVEGPSKGEILTKNGKDPESIAIIHCVGSLDERYKPYCSKVCCQYAFKFNRILRQRYGELKITHFVKEIVLPGRRAYELYQSSIKDPLVEIVRYENIDELSVRSDESILIDFKDRRYEVDVVVLCPAIISGDSISEISGIVPVGSIKEAMSVEEAVTDAFSAVGKILSELGDGRIIKSPVIAKIDYNRCKKCGICIIQCPYKAIELEMNSPTLIEALCEGCGICVVSCPAKAIDLAGFTTEQIEAEIEGILYALRRREGGFNSI
ncbi:MULTISPECIES: FAD-dependent oxidoreductase [Thermodesulfovibrio]|uniref:FAD-dependent oxidoreductase n=1 Tax=Thermodesulfovibrio TaxID=28261 RepID=UPI00263131DB|nr:FAD-dependent oxidoreductase [Thermodesulfovibrio sp.]